MNLPQSEIPNKKNVAIVDDHFAIRDGYKNILKKTSYIDCVCPFATGKELLNELKKKTIDLVLLDIELKNEDGLEICKHLKLTYKNIKVIILTSHHSSEYIIKAEQYDADGYLFKDAEPKEVRIAIDKVVNQNGRYFSSEAKSILAVTEDSKLTQREIQILQLVCEGKSNKEIGEIFNRDETTIAKHKQNMMNKINVHKSVEIIYYAIKHGYYTPKFIPKK